MSVTKTPTGHEVSEQALTERVMKIREVKDFRLIQTGTNAYRIRVLPENDADIRGLKGAVLDALVDMYGMRADYEIDITRDDSELRPEGERAILYNYSHSQNFFANSKGEI